jgi:hypothetical protein
MNYQHHYNLLITKGRTRGTSRAAVKEEMGYIEGHHIIPKCMGGDNSKDNIVFLTGREHFVAHQLLVKLFPEVFTLALAANFLAQDRRGGRHSSRSYEWVKKLAAEATSKARKNKTKFNDLGMAKSAASRLGQKKETHTFLLERAAAYTKLTTEQIAMVVQWKQLGKSNTEIKNYIREIFEIEIAISTVSGIYRRALGDTKYPRMTKGRVMRNTRILSAPQEAELFDLRENGLTFTKIHKYFSDSGVKISLPAIKLSYRRFDNNKKGIIL